MYRRKSKFPNESFPGEGGGMLERIIFQRPDRAQLNWVQRAVISTIELSIYIFLYYSRDEGGAMGQSE